MTTVVPGAMVAQADRVVAPDDRTAKVLTTVALFAMIAAVAYAARATIAVFVLALQFAYLLEPMVAWLERRYPRGRGADPARSPWCIFSEDC